jgi:DNA-binding transcriptional LysR family regulator
MNLHLLRLFSEVARHQSFSRAAESMRISQPAVSKGVRYLEDQVGSPLLERSPSRVVPTEAGRILMRYARDIFASEQAAEEALDAMHGLRRGTLRIGASTTVATYFLPPLLGSFSRAYPDIELRLTSANTLKVADLLVSRELDVALVEGPVDGGEIVARPWREDELVFAAAADHPLATQKQSLPLEALAGQTIVLREQGSGTRDVACHALRSAGFHLTRVLEVSGNEAIARVVEAGLGIGIVSSAVVADKLAVGRLVHLTIRGLTIRRTFSRLFLTGRQASPAAVAFDHLLDGA